MVLVDEVSIEGMKKYKYRSVDYSLISIYILQPFWNWSAGLFPEFIAPNVITLAGFILTALALSLCLYEAPTLSEPLGSLVSLYSAMALFLYQTLDNIDGRQARKLGLSSPLGEIFDHGMLFIRIVLKLLKYEKYALDIDKCSILDRQQTGVLRLGFFNGPTEGILIETAVFIVSAIDNNFWLYELKIPYIEYHIKNQMFIILIIMSSGIIMSIQRMENRSISRLTWSLGHLVPFLALTTFQYLWIHFGREYETNASFSLIFCGLQQSGMASRLILSRTDGTRFKPLSIALLPLPFLLLNMILDLIEGMTLFWISLFVTSLSFFHFWYTMTTVIPKGLGIPAFTVPNYHSKNR